MAGKKKQPNVWRCARQELNKVGAKNFTRQFGEMLGREHWLIAHMYASSLALNEDNTLWIDLNDSVILSDKYRLLGMLTLMEAEPDLYKDTLQKILEQYGKCDAFDSFAKTVWDSGTESARVLIFFKDVSCMLTPDAVVRDLKSRINSVTKGEDVTCTICMESVDTMP